MHDRQGSQAKVSNCGRRRNDCDSIVHRGELDQGLRCRAFHHDARPDLSQLAGRVEPRARSIFALHDEQRVIGQRRNFENSAARKGIRLRHHGQQMGWPQYPSREPRTCRHNCQMHFAPLQATVLASGTALNQQYINVRVALPVAGQERDQQAGDHLRGRGQPHDPCFPLFQRACVFCQRVRLRQQLTTALHKQLPLGRQTQSPSDVLEKGHPKLCLQRIDLTRGRRLTKVQSRTGRAKTAVLRGGDEGSQIPEIQSVAAIYAERA